MAMQLSQFFLIAQNIRWGAIEAFFFVLSMRNIAVLFYSRFTHFYCNPAQHAQYTRVGATITGLGLLPLCERREMQLHFCRPNERTKTNSRNAGIGERKRKRCEMQLQSLSDQFLRIDRQKKKIARKQAHEETKILARRE